MELITIRELLTRSRTLLRWVVQQEFFVLSDTVLHRWLLVSPTMYAVKISDVLVLVLEMTIVSSYVVRATDPRTLTTWWTASLLTTNASSSLSQAPKTMPPAANQSTKQSLSWMKLWQVVIGMLCMDTTLCMTALTAKSKHLTSVSRTGLMRLYTHRSTRSQQQMALKFGTMFTSRVWWTPTVAVQHLLEPWATQMISASISWSKTMTCWWSTIVVLHCRGTLRECWWWADSVSLRLTSSHKSNKNLRLLTCRSTICAN